MSNCRQLYYSSQGFDDFTAVLEDALNLLLQAVEVFIPFSKDDGLIAAIHTQGYVSDVRYTATGTHVSCRVPESLLGKLRHFRVPMSTEAEL